MNITKLGWTATIDGKDYGAFVTLVDADTTQTEMLDKCLELLNAQFKRTIDNLPKESIPSSSIGTLAGGATK